MVACARLWLVVASGFQPCALWCRLSRSQINSLTGHNNKLENKFAQQSVGHSAAAC